MSYRELYKTTLVQHIDVTFWHFNNIMKIMKIILVIHYTYRTRGKYFMFLVILDYRLRYI